MTIYTQIESVLGPLLLTSREKKLAGLHFLDRPHAPHIGPDWLRQDDAAIFLQAEQQLHEYAAGERKRFDLQVGLRGTIFQMRVWLEISAIPFGQTITYGELAKRVGAPQAVRAVGTATGANPVSWIIPCHRVVGKNGSLTGYAGGLPRKRALLDFETARSSGLDASLALEESCSALLATA